MQKWTLGVLITLGSSHAWAGANATNGGNMCTGWVMSNIELTTKMQQGPTDILGGTGMGRKPQPKQPYWVFNQKTDHEFTQFFQSKLQKTDPDKLPSSERAKLVESLLQGVQDILNLHEPAYMNSCKDEYKRMYEKCAAYDTEPQKQLFATCMKDFWKWNVAHTPLQGEIAEASQRLKDDLAKTNELEKLIKQGDLPAVKKYTNNNPASPFIQSNVLNHAIGANRMEVVKYFLEASGEYLYDKDSVKFNLMVAEKYPEIFAVVFAKIPGEFKSENLERCQRVLNQSALCKV